MIRHPDAIQILPESYCEPLDPDDWFECPGPLHVDVGCGDGGFLFGMAARRPECRHLGIERLFGRIRKVCRRAVREDVRNIRVLRLECRYAVRYLLPPASVARMTVLFPDPWPKARHAARRLISPGFIEAARRALAPGADLLIKTDHPGYAEWIRSVLDGAAGWAVAPWHAPDVDAVPTDFERVFLAEGRPIHRFRIVKPPRAADRPDARPARALTSAPPTHG